MELGNQTVYDFYKEKGTKETVEFVSKHLPNVSIPPTEKALENSVKRFVEKVEKLLKNKHRPKTADELSVFMNTCFSFPKGDSNKRGSRISNDEQLDLKQSLVDEKIKNQCLSEKLIATENEKCQTEDVVSAKNKQIEKLKLNLKRTAGRESYLLKKIPKLEKNVNKTCCSDMQNDFLQLINQLAEKEKDIANLQENVQYLTGLIEDIDNENRVIQVFDEQSRRYTSKFKSCVYELLKLNVSASKVGDVVKTVLKLVNVEPNRVPVTSTVLEMNLQRLCLAQKQLSEIFAKEDNTCILTDETSKFGKKFMGYEATDSQGNFWVLGLREIETKSAGNTLAVLKEILQDLDTASDSDNKEVSRDIISHIKATMSDRAATELKFNDLLQTYRKEILPLTYINYESFSEEERSSIESLNNYFCGLHALVNYAESAQKCLVEIEERIFDGESPIFDKSFKKSSEPGTCRLVRVASKAFGEGSEGDQKSGCQGSFKTYAKDFLQDKKLKSVPLKSYRGSRFNILFSNAASVYFLHEKMIEYLQTVGAENKLLKAVLFDLQVPEYVAGLKALGLISKFITCPLWCVLEDKNVSMADMNAKYLELVTFLSDAAINTEQFMNGQLEIFSEHLKKDYVYDYIVSPNQYDEACQGMLQVILSALCTLGKKLYKEHLPGGTLVNEGAPVNKGIPKTSCFAESVFGQMDQLMRTKPNLKTLAAESFIMFVNNRTLDWLNSKNEQEQNELIKKASKEVKSLKLKFKARIHEIEENRRIAMQEKIQKRENIERERLRKQEAYTNDIVKHGLWQSETEVDNMLATYERVSEKVDVLKTQLKFRKEVLLQVSETNKIFNVTKSVNGKRKGLSAEELASNLKSLVRQAVVKDQDSDMQRHILVGKRVRHRFDELRGGRKVTVWYTGKVISQVAILTP